MSELRTRDVVESDLAAVLRIRNRSFGPLGTGGEDWWRRVSDETLGGRMLAVVDDSDTVLGAGRIRPYQQVWGGRHLQMGGVAGVYVEPSARGRGVASTLMRGLITRMTELGDVVSCLYPTAPELYRGVGWEVGGVQQRWAYAAHDVRAARSLSGGLRPRPAGPADAELVHAIVRDQQVRHHLSGPMAPTVETWRQLLAEDGEMRYVLDGIDGGPRGFVDYSLSDGVLTVEHLVGETQEAGAALWAAVGSGSSAAPTVRTYLDPRDPARLQLAGVPHHEVNEHAWMLRVIDLPKALAARGFSPHVTASAEIVVDDPDAPANSGTWHVSVANGSGSAERAPASSAAYAQLPIERAVVRGPDAHHSALSTEGAARLGPRGLAALWSGWTMSRLRVAGLATGGSPEADEALDAIFGCAPFMTEYF